MNSKNWYMSNCINDLHRENEKVHLTLEVLEDLFSTIGAQNPETGGLLLGPINVDGISSFVFDTTGDISSASYSPSSDKLTALCKKTAKTDGLEMKGFCHSHPGNLCNPSIGDINYVRQFFDANPSMHKFYMPIIVNTPLSLHDLTYDSTSRLYSLGNCTKFAKSEKHAKGYQIPTDWQDHLRFFIVNRANPDQPVPAEVVLCNQSCFPLINGKSVDKFLKKEHIINIESLKRMLNRSDVIESFISIDGHEIYCIDVMDGNTQLTVLLPSEFPILQPQVLITKPETGSFQFRLCWTFDDKKNIHRRLADLINTALSESLDIF